MNNRENNLIVILACQIKYKITYLGYQDLVAKSYVYLINLKIKNNSFLRMLSCHERPKNFRVVLDLLIQFPSRKKIVRATRDIQMVGLDNKATGRYSRRADVEFRFFFL